MFGITDDTHKVVGTTFHAKKQKKGNEELELWLSNRLDPRIDFEVHEFDYDDQTHISLYKIPAAINRPITFLHKAYIRIGSLTKLLGNFSDKEAKIWKALRKEVRMYPEISIRELVANSIIHQDFAEQGFPMVEIYSDRIEISNPGLPLISSERFIDEYVSRNDSLADLMRRMGFCEEKGSGLDKTIFYNELYQLPAINIFLQERRTIVCMYAYKTFNNTDKNDKIRACYQHACLKYVSNEKMTNQSLRERFGIEPHNYSIASRIIRDALEDKVIKEDDPESKSRKFASYIPFWA